MDKNKIKKGEMKKMSSLLCALIGLTLAFIVGCCIVDRAYYAYIDFCNTWGNGTFETNLVSGSWERINCTAWNLGEINVYSDVYNLMKEEKEK